MAKHLTLAEKLEQIIISIATATARWLGARAHVLHTTSRSIVVTARIAARDVQGDKLLADTGILR